MNGILTKTLKIMQIKKPYSPYQEMNYRLAYSTDTRKKVKATHYCVYYNGKAITTAKSYPLCQIDIAEFRKMGIQFPNKDLLQIKPAKT